MKDIIKRWWFWATIIIIILFFVTLLILQRNDGVGTAGISLQEYNEISIGMGNIEVNSIIDKRNEWDDDDTYDRCVTEIENTKEGKIYKYTYKYQGEKGGYATITFLADYTNGDLFVLPTVSSKKQFDLK